MTADKVQTGSLTSRQKVMAGVFVVIVLVIIWQVVGLFSGGGDNQPPLTPAPQANMAKAPAPTGQGGPGLLNQPGGAPVPPNAQQSQPQAAQTLPQAPLTQREMELLRLQQETEAKYITALNELQLLKISQSIAETNKAIATAKLDTVDAQKKALNLLSPQMVGAGAYSQAAGGVSSSNAPTGAPGTAGGMPSGPVQAEVSYTVISVTLLQHKWNAVLGYQGSLYSVAVGDRLPPDNSKVISIDKSGVVLEKDGQKKKVSLVPII